MDNALYVAMSRQAVLRREMDIVANNVANVDTAGFKVESLISETQSKALSGGKDSVVMLHLATKAFWPAPVPFPVLHVDTGHNFPEVLAYRDATVERLGLRLEVAHVTVRAEIADEMIAGDLGVALGSAILTVEMLYQSADLQSVEFTIARHPADLFSITYDAPNDLA